MSAKTKFVGLVLVATVMAAGGYWLAMEPKLAPASAPAKASLATGTPYDALARLPDFSGPWLADPQPTVLETDEQIPLAPEFATKLADARVQFKANGKLPDNPLCKPAGLPLYMALSQPLMDIQFAPGHVFMNSGKQEYRDIHTDGRALPAEPEIDAYEGTSVGHWDGDTLVVETIGILEDGNLFPGIQNGGGLTVSEKIRLIGPDKLQDEITLKSDKAFTQPYTYTRTFTRHTEWEVSEYICLTDSHAVYKIEGYTPSEADQILSTTRKPVVRVEDKPSGNWTSLAGGSWASIAKLPEWLGFWSLDPHPGGVNEVVAKEYVPLTKGFAEYFQSLKEMYARPEGGDIPSDIYHCRPRGAPQMMKAAGGGFFLVQTPGRMTLVANNGQARRFYLDGRPHPANLEPSFNGHSIAHWEGAMLVVDTVGLRPDVQMFYGVPSAGGLHLVERIRQIGPQKIEFISTQDNPKTLLAPWSYNRTFTRHSDWNMLEDYCAQNNRDVHPETGLQTFDLTPPPQE